MNILNTRGILNKTNEVNTPGILNKLNILNTQNGLNKRYRHGAAGRALNILNMRSKLGETDKPRKTPPH